MNAPSGYKIERVMSEWMSVRARILTEDPDLENDEASISSIIGPEDGDVLDILSRVLLAAQHAASLSDAAEAMAKTLTGRAKRYLSRSDKLRETALAIMEIMGDKKVEFPTVTATVRAGKEHVIITNETLIPEEYLKTTKAPIKSAIHDDIKLHGVVIPGAELSNAAPILTLRSK